MHNPTINVNGSIDGTALCSCGWRRYAIYPGKGWSRKSIGIKRSNRITKPEYLKRKLLLAYVRHEAGAAA